MLKIYVFPPTMTVRLMRPWATSGQFGGTAWVGAPRAVLRGWANIAATYYIPSTYRRFCFRMYKKNARRRRALSTSISLRYLNSRIRRNVTKYWTFRQKCHSFKIVTYSRPTEKYAIRKK